MLYFIQVTPNFMKVSILMSSNKYITIIRILALCSQRNPIVTNLRVNIRRRTSRKSVLFLLDLLEIREDNQIGEKIIA